MTEFADVKITSDGLRHTLTVNGADVTNDTARVVVESAAGEIARVLVELQPRGVIFEGQGVVHVMACNDDPDAMHEWLANIDPSVLSREVLSRSTSLGGPDPITLALDILKEWARGG